MLTGDGEIVVLPIKYVEELRHLPPSVISSLDAQFEVRFWRFSRAEGRCYLCQWKFKLSIRGVECVG